MSSLAIPVFWIAALAVVVGQAMILRSTSRAWRAAGTPVPLTERLFAWGPVLVLAVVLWLSYRATFAPPLMQVETALPAAGVRL